MSSQRQLIFASDYVYHVYNRGIDRRTIFQSKKDYSRFLDTLEYYRFTKLPLKFSKYSTTPIEQKATLRKEIEGNPSRFSVLAYCLMPNHFHLLLRQESDNGIAQGLSEIQNSYAKFFNEKYERSGPLFQGYFKAVFIESDEQLLHVSRYIHLNPYVSSRTKLSEIDIYPWSSLGVYLSPTASFVKTSHILDHFSSKDDYRSFVFDHLSYAKSLEAIKHLTLAD